MKIFQYGGRHQAIGTMWLTMWPVTWPTEANENTRVARGTLSAITVGSSNLCTGSNSGHGPKHCSGSKFQCRPRPGHAWVHMLSAHPIEDYWDMLSGISQIDRHIQSCPACHDNHNPALRVLWLWHTGRLAQGRDIVTNTAHVSMDTPTTLRTQSKTQTWWQIWQL